MRVLPGRPCSSRPQQTPHTRPLSNRKYAEQPVSSRQMAPHFSNRWLQNPEDILRLSRWDASTCLLRRAEWTASDTWYLSPTLFHVQEEMLTSIWLAMGIECVRTTSLSSAFLDHWAEPLLWSGWSSFRKNRKSGCLPARDLPTFFGGEVLHQVLVEACGI